MGFFRSVMFALGLTAAGLAGCEESSKPPVVRQDAGIDARVDADNNGRRDAARPVNDTGYHHDVYDAGSDATKGEDAYDATRPSDAYDAAQMFDAHDAMHTSDADAQQPTDVGMQSDANITDAQRIEDVFDAAPEAGYDAERADAHDAVYADAQSDAGNPPACQPWEEREFYRNGEGAAGVGICRAGLERCLPQQDDSFAYVTIRDQIGPRRETCNYEDDDCDHEIDEGVRRLFHHDEDRDGYGSEVDVLEACEQPDGYVGRAGDCDDRNNQVNPDAPELCDQEQRDETCDGAVNEGCECLEAEVRSCASDEGECETGLQICDFDGAYSPCIGARGPEPERCDGKDNSCDGQTDERYELGVECLVGVGACERTGVTICAPDGLATICSARSGQPQEEKCDGSDADCDGIRNNGYDVGAACEVGVGACRSQGQKVCDLDLDARVTRCDAPIIEPQPEVCADGIDQDCTGEADDDPVCEFLIAYICSGEGKDICLITLDGNGKRILVNQPGDDWNRDESTAPTNPPYALAWSPDRQWVAYVHQEGQDEIIQRVNLEGRIETVVNYEPNASDLWAISYSNFGNKLMFSEFINGGSARIMIYDFERLELSAFVTGTRSVWSPDGQSIIYRNWPREPYNYFQKSVEEGESQQLTNHNQGRILMFVISPDGKNALYSSDIDGNLDIYHLNLETGEEREVYSATPRDAHSPQWFPDNNNYVFVSNVGNRGERMVIQRDFRWNIHHILTPEGSNNDLPTVSPDGRYVVFVTDRHGTKDLYKVEVATGIETRLTDDPGDEEAPVFAPVAR